MWWSKVLQSTTKYNSVLQSTTPVLLCTTKHYSSTTLYYSSTTPYYKVLLQYYKVIQSTTLYYKVLQSTTLYYSSTTLYCKVLLQHYSVLQSTTPVLLCITKYYSSTTLYYKVLLCTTKYYSSTILYYKVTLMIDLCHIWTVIYTARSNKSQPPTSPNTAPATQNECDDWSASHMKRHLQCAEQQESASNFTKYCACHEKWLSWLILVTYETLFTMRGVTRVTIQLHQILRMPRKMNLMIDPRLTWNVIYNARSNKSQLQTSPNTAPVTKFWVQDFSGKSLTCFRRYKNDSTMIRG